MTDDSVFSSLQTVAGTRYNRSEYNKDILDTYLLHKAREQGIRLPTGGDPDEYKFLGAFVEDTTAGMNENVVYCDLASLYPSNILSLNASPETIVGTQEELEASQYTEDDCVWGYIDPRPVKHLDEGTPKSEWKQYTNGSYKMVYDPHQTNIKWTCDEAGGPQYERLYFLRHDVQKGFLTNCVDDLIQLKELYRGTPLYGATKQVVNCFSSDTEVMTPDGVMDIQNLEIGDKVYSFNTETEKVEVKPVTETFAYPEYDDEMITMETGRVDFSVTPNHNMVAKKSNDASVEGYQFYEAGELEPHGHYEFPHDWSISHGDTLESVDITQWLDQYTIWFDNGDTHGHTVRHNIDGEISRQQVGGRDNCRSGYRVEKSVYEENKEYIEDISDEVLVHSASKHKWIPKDYDGDKFIQLLAWYITEGSSRICGGDKEKYDTTRGKTWQTHIAQENIDGHISISNLLKDMGLDPYEDSRGFSLSSKSLYTVLRQLCGTDSFNKTIPEFVFNCSERQKQLFWETLIEGDGDNSDSSHRYTTSSQTLRDDFMRLCVHLGRNPRYSRDSNTWRILYSEARNQIRPHRTVEQDVAEDGVYCVSVKDNHTLLAGRNGKFQFCGNSVYGIVGTAREGSSERLFDWRLAEAITLTGRKIIKGSRDYLLDELHDRGYDDAYACSGDTDATAISLPTVATNDEALRVVGDVVEQLNNEGYDELMQETFGVPPEHRETEIEIESFAPRLFIPADDSAPDYPHTDVGVKKRYIQWETWNDDDGYCDEISITGLEAQRSDTMPVVQEAQELFAATLPRDNSDGKEWLFPQLRELAEGVQEGTMDLSRMCKRGGIGQSLSEYGTATRRAGPLYRGAKYANENIDGVTIQHGDKPAVIYVKQTGDYPSTYDTDTAEDGDLVDAVSLPNPENLPDEFEIDYQKHWQKFRSSMNPLLETRGWPWDSILSSTEQDTLQSFAVGD